MIVGREIANLDLIVQLLPKLLEFFDYFTVSMVCFITEGLSLELDKSNKHMDKFLLTLINLDDC